MYKNTMNLFHCWSFVHSAHGAFWLHVFWFHAFQSPCIFFWFLKSMELFFALVRGAVCCSAAFSASPPPPAWYWVICWLRGCPTFKFLLGCRKCSMMRGERSPDIWTFIMLANRNFLMLVTSNVGWQEGVDVTQQQIILHVRCGKRLLNVKGPPLPWSPSIDQ